MTWDRGFNFRATSTYVTDGAGETYVLGEPYPVTRNGVTFGWTTAVTSPRDRATSNDVRLAGNNGQINSGTQAIFRVDLPAAGQYDLRLALGDAGFSQGYMYVQVRDGATALLTIDDTDGAAINFFDDATGAAWNGSKTDPARWGANNSPVTVTLSGTTLTVALGSPAAQVNTSPLAHLFVSQVAGGGSPQTAIPSPSVSSWIALAAIITLGAVTVTPAPAISTWTPKSPTASVGAVTASQAPAISTWVAKSPTATNGTAPQTGAPAAATSAWSVPSPAITLGAVTRAAAVATSAWAANSPTVALGPIVAAPAPAVLTWSTRPATVTLGGLTRVPASVVSTWVTPAPTITNRPVGAHDAALTGAIATRARLTGAIATSPALTGTVTARPRLTGTITLRPLP